MDTVIESKVVEQKFDEAERRRMRRARNIDATQFIRTAWDAPLATPEELAQIMRGGSSGPSDRGGTIKEIASVAASLVSGSGVALAHPVAVKGGLAGISALALAYPIRRWWRRWSR